MNTENIDKPKAESYENYFFAEESKSKAFTKCSEKLTKASWVYWGEKNDYPENLLKLKDSAIHTAIINSKAQQVKGLGFGFEEGKQASEKTAQFLKTINDNFEEANDVLQKCALDYSIFSGMALAVTWTKDWTEIASVEHVNFSKLRASKVNEYGDVEGYFYSFDWANSKIKPVFIPKFDPTSAEDKGKAYKKVKKAFEDGDKENYNDDIFKGRNNLQILYHFKYDPSTFYYPSVSYQGGITSILADIESDKFALTSLENGMTPSYMVTFFKVPKEDAQKKIVREFEKKHTGSENAKKILYSFVKSIEEKPQIDPIQSQNSDKQFVNINENTVTKILSSHNITNPILCGIAISGKLGASNEVVQSQQLYFNREIQPAMHEISKQFNKILEVNKMERVNIIPNDPFYILKNQVEDGKEVGNNSDIDDLNTTKRDVEEEDITNE